MIIGKKDKNKMQELERNNKLLNDDLFKKQFESEAYNILKAIILKFSKQEIVIDYIELENAKQCQLYVENELLRHAKKYKVINPRGLLENFKGE